MFDVLSSLKNTVSRLDLKILLQLLKILEELGQIFQLLKQPFPGALLNNYSEKFNKFTLKLHYKLFLVSFGEFFITVIL